jgi:ATP-binding cassette subfamily A (ABC1) protein 3
MEEADMLGDSLGIMAEGRLRAFGTSLQLKHQYGSGYSLNLVKRASDVLTGAITACVHDFIPSAALRTDAGHDLVITLPIDASASFPQLFRELEARSGSLGIATFGLAQTSLEEVFLRLADSSMDDDDTETESSFPASDQGQQAPLPQFECRPSFCLQLKAIIQQVAINARRNKVGLMHGIFAPVFMTYLGTLVVPFVQNLAVPEVVDMLAVDTADIIGRHTSRGNCSSHPWAGNTVLEGLVLPGKPAQKYASCDKLVDALGDEANMDHFTADAYIAFCHDDGIPTTTMLFNQTEPYSSRAALACYYDSVAQTSGGHLSTSYQPFPAKVGANQIVGGALMGFVSNIFMLQTVFYCEEMMRLRVDRVKEMLLLSGVPRLSFWTAYFLSHMAFFVMAWTLSYSVMMAAGMRGVVLNSWVAYYALALAAGPTFITYGYALSFLVQDFVQCHQWVGNWLNVTYSIFWMILTFGVTPGTAAAKSLEGAFCLMPGFAFYQGIAKLEVAALNNRPFTWSDTFVYERGLLRSILLLQLDFLVLCALIFVVDTGLFARLAGPRLGAEVGIDDDQRELQELLPAIVGATPAQRGTNAAHAEDLSKRYALRGGGSVQAVRHTSIGVPPDCIMGLLGPNGAGKTSMVSMLAGLEPIDSGDAWIASSSVTTDLGAARRKLGLCPQFDALLPLLSARETLRMFATIRGVPADVREALVARTIDEMGLRLKADSRVGTYSGGNKRKLSVALAMVSDPVVSFLDEPSTGMDPKTRRGMWDFLLKMRAGRGIILTTHSMEEADALADNIAIMVRGELRALGP